MEGWVLALLVATSTAGAGDAVQTASVAAEVTEAATEEDGPIIELPEEEEEEAAKTDGDRPLTPEEAELERLRTDLTRGLRAYRFAIAANTAIGGYGEIVYYQEMDPNGPDPDGVADLRRIILFVAHRFNDWIRFYAELEVEHALAGADLPGYVGFEQATLEFLLSDTFNVRLGMILMPMGFINQWHEPTVFHGVDRPAVERNIIPSTWREGGVGLFGSLAEGLDYELYLVTGLDPLGFERNRAIAGGRQQFIFARTAAPALTARVEYEPILGTVFGAAGYFGLAGPNARDLFDANGDPLDLDVPVLGFAVDARTRYRGIEARAVAAMFSVGDTAELRTAVDEDGNFVGPDTASLAYGAYAEVAYDVLHTFDTEHQILPFTRVEHYDTMAKLDGRDKTQADAALARTDLVLGLSYRPILQVILKTDAVVRFQKGLGHTETVLNVGAGFMF